MLAWLGIPIVRRALLVVAISGLAMAYIKAREVRAVNDFKAKQEQINDAYAKGAIEARLAAASCRAAGGVWSVLGRCEDGP